MYHVTWQQYWLWILKYKSVHCFFRGEPWVLHRKIFSWSKLWLEFRTHSKRPPCPSFQSFHFLLSPLIWLEVFWLLLVLVCSGFCWWSETQKETTWGLFLQWLKLWFQAEQGTRRTRKCDFWLDPGLSPWWPHWKGSGPERTGGYFSWQIKILTSCSVNWLQWFSPTSLGWLDDLAREASDLKIGKDTGQDTFVRFKLEVRGSHLSLVGGACAFKDFHKGCWNMVHRAFSE